MKCILWKLSFFCSIFADESYVTNGYLETVIDWIPGMKNVRLRDLPSFIRTTNPNDFMFGFAKGEAERASNATAVVFNTVDALEHDVLDALSSMFPRVYAIGPFQFLLNRITDGDMKMKFVGSNLWKEEPECIQWLNLKKPNSVVYVNFGSITIMSSQQLIEFAWGLANSNLSFLWIIRYDLLVGESIFLPPK